jgi:TolA-binding protein
MANSFSTDNLKQQFKDNKQLRTISFAVGGIIVLLAGFLLYKQFVSGPKNEKSKDAFYTGLNYAAKDSTDQAIKALEPIVKKYDGYVGGEDAQFVLGRQYMEKGNFKKALETLEDVKASDTYVKVYVIGLQGDCYSELGKYKEALEKYESAARTNPNDKTSPEYLFKAAMVAEQIGEFDKATGLYEEIRDNYSVYAGQKGIDKYIARTSNTKKK